jgi:opacity protein-like surface antigen
MKKIIGSFALLSLLTMAAFSAHAEGEGIKIKGFYIGGGIGFNNAGSGAQGIQLFGGYDFNFKINEDISTAVEVGYMDSGDFDGTNDNARGLWMAAVESVPLSSKTDMLVRLGYDFGDDDGFLLGTGMQYKFNTKLAFRMEYIARQNITSLQANLILKF